MFFVTIEYQYLFAAEQGNIHGKDFAKVMENSKTVMSEIEMSLVSEMGSKTPGAQGFQTSGAKRHIEL